MDDLLKYLNKQINVIDAVISRETLPNGIECIYVNAGGEGYLYNFFVNPVKDNKEKPKHTGGKKSYVKVYIEKLNDYDISIESLGFMVKLFPNIQWTTGYLIKKRSKKKLLIDDIVKLVNKSNKTVIKIMKELKDNKLLSKDSEGYRINSEFIMKGNSK